MACDSPANAAFIKAWHAFTKNPKRVTNDPMEAHYIGFNMWVKAVQQKQAAREAEENWAKQFQKHETPDDLAAVTIKVAEVAASGDGTGTHSVRIDKLLAKTGLADSASDGQRKIKQHAVKIDGQVCEAASLELKIPHEFVVRVGRQMKKIRIEA